MKAVVLMHPATLSSRGSLCRVTATRGGRQLYRRPCCKTNGWAMCPWSVAVLALLGAASHAAADSAPSTYTVDVRNAHKQILAGHLKMGTSTNPAGASITANNFYLSRNGSPWLP